MTTDEQGVEKEVSDNVRAALTIITEEKNKMSANNLSPGWPQKTFNF